MDNADNTNGSRRPEALRQPFIETANALASLYKQAVTAERDARDAGARAAYMKMMEWAARKSRDNERVTTADVLNFCSSELAALTVSQCLVEEVEEKSVEAPPQAYIARDDGLVSDIRKLHVNPRKRQRVDISDTFVSAFGGCETDSLLFPEDGYFRASSPSESRSTLQTDRQMTATPPRREARDPPLISSSAEVPLRRAKSSKAIIYDKLKRK